MLVLTRRIGESLMLNSDVKITILKIGATKIRLGFTAPDGVTVLREEIYRPTEEVKIPEPIAEK